MLDNHTQTQNELLQFRNLLCTILPRMYLVEEAFEDIFIVNPIYASSAKFQQKDIALTFFAVMHGNESGGVGVLNRMLVALARKDIQLKFPIALGLGNPKAAAQGIRFIDRDLNRCFDRAEKDLYEEKRADQIEEVLSNTLYFLDLHQTRVPSIQPFFISGYTQSSFEFACRICPDLPIVTRWGQDFSPLGKCSDDFVKERGGIGTTLELGQNGHDIRQIYAGSSFVLSALRVVEEQLGLRSADFDESEGKIRNPVYTLSQTVASPGPTAFMTPGFINFSYVKKGDVLNEENNIVAPCDGNILFPKYPDGNIQNAKATAEMDLCRIMRRISLRELPK